MHEWFSFIMAAAATVEVNGRLNPGGAAEKSTYGHQRATLLAPSAQASRRDVFAADGGYEPTDGGPDPEWDS
jgi:hypothetical protein